MSDPDSDAEAVAMAAAMGFSSFGSAPAKKKRKFNAATDAFVERQELEIIDRGGKKGKGSGGNSVALGKMREFGTGSGSANGGNSEDGKATTEGAKTRPVENDAEIELEEGGDGSEEERPNYVDTSLPAPIEEGLGFRGGGEEEGPNYVDTSLPPPSAGKGKEREAQEKIDNILASTQPVSGNQVHGLPARPPPFLNEPQSRVLYGNLPSGIPREKTGADKWWEGYYDQSFNINPWEHLEKEKELSPVGSWLVYGHWDSKRGVRVTPASAAGS